MDMLIALQMEIIYLIRKVDRGDRLCELGTSSWYMFASTCYCALIGGGSVYTVVYRIICVGNFIFLNWTILCAFLIYQNVYLFLIVSTARVEDFLFLL